MEKRASPHPRGGLEEPHSHIKLSGLNTLLDLSEPAWRSKPSFYLVATDDRMIPPAAQRMMARRAGAQVTEAFGSHAIYVSNPEAVAALIRQAAQ
jgi:pimeloyl-ACP methyl ester carboxylesterase